MGARGNVLVVMFPFAKNCTVFFTHRVTRLEFNEIRPANIMTELLSEESKDEDGKEKEDPALVGGLLGEEKLSKITFKVFGSIQENGLGLKTWW